MTQLFSLNIATAIFLGAGALASPLAAENMLSITDIESAGVPFDNDAPASAMTRVSAAKTGAMSARFPSQAGSSLAPLGAVRGGANILSWSNEFAEIDQAKPWSSQGQSAAPKATTFGLKAITPDFGEPETLSSEFDLADGITFQPRTPVRQSVGPEFENTYAFNARPNEAARVDGEVRTVGRVTNLRVRF